MNFLIDNAQRIADALPLGALKDIAEEFGMSHQAVKQYLSGHFTLTTNNPARRNQKRLEILKAAIQKLEPAADVVNEWNDSVAVS